MAILVWRICADYGGSFSKDRIPSGRFTSVPFALRHPVGDVVVVALAAYERVLAQSRARRPVEGPHADGDVVVVGHVRRPKERGSAGRAEAAAHLLRRLVPRDLVLAVHGEVLLEHVDRGKEMSRLLPALDAVARFGLLLELPGNLEIDRAAEAGCFHHDFHSFAYAARKFTGGDVTDRYSNSSTPIFSNPCRSLSSKRTTSPSLNGRVSPPSSRSRPVPRSATQICSEDAWRWGGFRPPGATVTRVIVKRSEREFSGKSSCRDVMPPLASVTTSADRMISTCLPCFRPSLLREAQGYRRSPD